MELKELEIRLAYSFASQLNKPFVSKLGLTLLVLFKPIPKKQESLASHPLEIEFPKKGSFFAPQPSLLKVLYRLLSKTKESTKQRRYTIRYPKLFTFSTNFEKTGIHRGDMCPGSLNLYQVR